MVAKIEPEERTCPACRGTFLVGGTGNKKRSTKTCSPECAQKVGWIKTGKHCAPLSLEHAAYLAGMLDADGHIGLYRHSTSLYRVTINVSNTDLELLNWIRGVTGIGSVNRQRPQTDRTKACFTWNSMSHSAVTFLEQILPYMRVKRERAELALSYHQFMCTQEGRLDVEGQLRYREKMLALNRRGPLPAAA